MHSGNRPEEKVSTDLGVADVKGNDVDVLVPTAEKDINAAYDDAVHVLASPAPKEVKKVNAEEKMTDSYRAIRTNVRLAAFASLSCPRLPPCSAPQS